MPRKISFKGRAAAAACLGVSLLYALAWLTPAAAPTAARAQSGPSLFVRTIPVTANDVVYSPSTKRLYASVPSRAGAGGNSVATVDPAAGTLEGYDFVGSEPNKLALADDGHTLYVGLDGAAAVRRFDAATHTAGAQFSLGESTSNGPLFAKDMAVAPGNPDLVAVSRRNVTSSAEFEGVAVYDGGVQRPLATRSHTGSDNIAFSDTADVLYGFTELSGGGLEKLGVNASGLSVVKSTRLSTQGGDFKYSGGLLYMPFGQVYDAESAALAGTFALPFSGGLGILSLVEPDPSAGRVYFLTSGESAYGNYEVRTVTLRAFDQKTFLPLGSVQIPNVVGRVTGLVRWGANGLAFNSTGGQLYVIQTSLVPSNEPVPTPTPTPSPTTTPTPTPTPTPAPGDLREVAVVAKDIVYDRAAQTAYASVPSSVGSGGNSITPFDPFSAAVGQPAFVGSEPGRMAISDNGQYIYVGLDGAKAVRRFDVATRTPGLQFSLGNDIFGQQLSAVDLAVPPGQPQTVAVVRGGGGTSGGGVAVYDDGVQRPNVTGVFHTINVIEYSASPLVLYGHNNSTTEGGFRKLAVEPCGVSVLGVRESLLWGTDFKIENGLAYSTSGRVADPESGTLVGTFPVTADLSSGYYPSSVVVDSAAGRIYFFVSENDGFNTGNRTLLVRAYDLRTFLHVGTLAVPNVLGATTAAFRWGADGLAFRTLGNKVYLLRTSLIPAATQTPAPAPSPTPPSYTLRGQVGGFGGPPQPAPVTLSLSGPLTGTATTNPDGSFAFTRLPFCADFTVTPLPVENYTFSPASVTITSADQNNPNRATAFFNMIPNAVTFSQPSALIGEGTSSVALTVRRIGDLSKPAAVFYQTNDNTASERSDYNAAVGTLRFEANESAKTISVFITDDARAEPPETFTVSLSSPEGVLLGSITTLTVTINDNDAANGANNPVDDSAFFVRQHYRDFLSRDPDSSGQAFWTNEIEQCGADLQCREVKRINVSAAFFLSIEFQETGYLAYRMHKAAYGDTTSPGVAGAVPVIRLRDFLADAQRIGQGVVVNVGAWQQQLEANKNSYAQEFVQRQRFTDAYPSGLSADEFVGRLDRNAGGVLSADERAQLVTSLSAAPGDALKRAAVLRSVAEDADLRAAELNRAFVLMQYYGYLRRNPDDAPEPGLNFAGWQFWLSKLEEFRGDAVAAEMVKAFITSDEYRKRFGQ
ncbi:MAG TPA: Calx-beta domain-containing protein [Pyrinomonadaceae bacterium]|nr:Calx-beta domain-containing protein [Pyrinomonadaceae bacterium]